MSSLCFDKLLIFNMQLLATRLLADLVYFNPILQETQRTTTGPIVSTRSPQLTNGHGFAGRHKLPYVIGMPIGDAFLDTLDKAWIAQVNRRREVLSPRWDYIFTR